METRFTTVQLHEPDMRDCATAVRKCVHCGFCQATCPTYVELGDELDSPRGRIMLMKSMLEEERPASEREVRHIDRCLSCLACVSTCPSGVNYMHLIDRSRAWVEETYKRPWADRGLRALLAWLLPRPALFRAALRAARLGHPFASFLPERLRAMLKLAPKKVPAPSNVDLPQSFQAQGTRLRRVALLTGCAQPVLAPHINEATVRLLTRLGCEVVVANGMGCCGALTHHMGKTKPAHDAAKANIDAWWREHSKAPLDAIVINASGCGTTVKDYDRMLRDDIQYAEKAAELAALAMDVSELLTSLSIPQELLQTRTSIPLSKVTYHAACSLQHGQQLKEAPKALLRQAGFSVAEPRDSHLCCGSAGTYNILQSSIADKLKTRKLDTLAETTPQVVATGNIGCMTQLAGGLNVPVVHTVELLDWATGGPIPEKIRAKMTEPANK